MDHDMASTADIDKAAKDLGEMIADHPAARRFDEAAKALDSDVQAQRLMNDFNRAIQALAEKQASQKPIEVADKHKLEQLQTQVATNLKVQALQKAQMDYVDLLRKVVTTITAEAGGVEPEAAAGGANPMDVTSPMA
jgi:cell fate (sporulation/competence/biofilm development) regulator YlbF (YheA/YmcA/DUF963 family)